MRTLTRLVSLVLAVTVAGCGSGMVKEAPLEHARANTTLQGDMAKLAVAGWSVADLTTAQVDQYDPSGADTSASATWTRVRVPVSHANEGSPLEAQLVLAWAEGQEDVFALAPSSQAAAEKLVSDLAEKQAPADAAPGDSDAASSTTFGTVAQALTCGGLGYARDNCTDAHCCRGLTCANHTYYSSCDCKKSVTVTYPSKFTVSTACVSLWGNPLGAAYYMRYWRGCADGGQWNLSQDACGRTQGPPAYTTSITDQFICGQYNCY